MKNMKIYAVALAFSLILGYGVANHVNRFQGYAYQKDRVTQSVSSTLLKGTTVCIDAGHGKTSRLNTETEPIAPGAKIRKAATASGTRGVATGVSEASLNLTVAKKLKESLLQKGAKVVMIRETEECGLTNVERAKLWNSSEVDLTIRIHGNGINDSSISGVLMMVPGNKYINDTEILRNSRKAGELVLEGVLEHTKAKSRGIEETSELTGFNWSKVPVILLEMGFMTNPEEDRLLNTDEYQNKMVAGITEGLIKYVN
ncbi:N-acetylmuramoyl-L-alanine amidase [Ruminiclostridium cellulolyticum]|uniref:Cell wall hydrolase/autolysin n=1 Tax=Ruminiclostridium cellulolyticum (strain ATCC 35319 / DSM 5812 / JCM 6584 / H10) TaxID=394503 RepID=B8I0V7_RUMCH|nr:N-acetylmuramoyl-L-alanine amidase [Ruminiclostridium cellulolyticum]ACL77513.1 cell wall hydrolase/autolysin [Ruminiclostridium cellulolyticum H10]